MILLDTNVVSELMKPAPSERVVSWVSEQPGGSLFTTSVTQAEILYGVRLLPSGRHRKALEKAVEAMFREDFARRILPFDAGSAPVYAQIAADRRRAGRPVSQLDAQIAAIARAAGAALATRNVSDFAGCGISLVDPWSG